MPDTCCVPGCHLRDSKEVKAKGISFHKIPKDPELRQRWLRAISRPGKDETKEWVPGPGARVCSAHFTEQDFHPFANIRVLKCGKVPCLSPGMKSHQQVESKVFPPATHATVTLSALKYRSIREEHNYALLNPEQALKKLQAYQNRIHDSELKLEASRKQINRQQEKIQCLIAQLAKQKPVRCSAKKFQCPNAQV